MTAAGIGTATQVCDGRVVGFGHPMAFSGPATMSMHPAEALYVQPDSLGAPFKVANLSAPVGTITDDRLTGITGSYEEFPDALTVSSDITMGSRHREGSTQVTVPSAAAEMTFYQLVGNHDRVVDGITAGTETQTWSIKGTDGAGRPINLSFSDRFTSQGDITYEASVELADLVYAISSMPGVTLDEVTHDGVVTSSKATYRLGSIQQLRAGKWVTVSRKAPATVKAGRRLVMRAVLVGPAGQKTVQTSFVVPKRAKGSRGSFMFTGGASTFSEAAYQESLPAILAELKKMIRNDAVQADLGIAGSDSW